MRALSSLKFIEPKNIDTTNSISKAYNYLEIILKDIDINELDRE